MQQGLTPVQRRGLYWFKRDDLFRHIGRDGRIATGGKARTSIALIRQAIRNETEGIVTGGGRDSVQIAIVAIIAESLDLPCRVHVSAGRTTETMRTAQAAGAELVLWRPGYLSVVGKRAADDASDRGWTFIPLALHCREAVRQTSKQVRNLQGVRLRRIVVPVGSGMSLCGVLQGLQDVALEVPVLGVQVGADRSRTIRAYGPSTLDWLNPPSLELVRAEQTYAQPAVVTSLEGLPLDPFYEAKCIPFMRSGDLLWVVGHRDPKLVEREDRDAT